MCRKGLVLHAFLTIVPSAVQLPSAAAPEEWIQHPGASWDLHKYLGDPHRTHPPDPRNGFPSDDIADPWAVYSFPKAHDSLRYKKLRHPRAAQNKMSLSSTALIIMSLTMRKTLAAAALQLPLVLSQATPEVSAGNTCVVQPGPNGTDSAPAIIEAFENCGHNDAANRGKVVFLNQTYTVKTVMNTTGLSNVDVDQQGTLLWDKNVEYWLNNSLPVGYQNQSSAWLFGGESITWDGHGYGTLDGNGQVWYDYINGTNNYPGRPHSITYTGTRDSVIEGLRFVQSQMW